MHFRFLGWSFHTEKIPVSCWRIVEIFQLFRFFPFWSSKSHIFFSYCCHRYFNRNISTLEKFKGEVVFFVGFFFFQGLNSNLGRWMAFWKIHTGRSQVLIGNGKRDWKVIANQEPWMGRGSGAWNWVLFFLFCPNGIHGLVPVKISNREKNLYENIQKPNAAFTDQNVVVGRPNFGENSHCLGFYWCN